MCGRFTQQRSDHELAEYFDAEQLVDDPGGRFNVAPTDPVSIVELQGTTGAAPAIDRKEGFAEATKVAPNLKVVASQTGDFTR